MNDRSPNPDVPRPASTVILVRDRDGRLEVYLLRRSEQSSFFPGNYVFPGGAVGAQDRDAAWWERHVDLPLEERIGRFGGGLGPNEILAYGVSAIRETFEEAGVFLGEKRPGSAKAVEDLAQCRIPEGLRKGWLRERVERDSLVLGFSRLSRWAHWITPRAMHMRFDTRFFVARVPREQECSPDLREMSHGAWLTPEQALAGNLAGVVPLSPPTLVTLNEMLPCASLAALDRLLENRPWGQPVLPVFQRFPDGALLVEPWDPFYAEDMEIRHSDLDKPELPLGAPFSRLGYREGTWRPIRC